MRHIWLTVLGLVVIGCVSAQKAAAGDEKAKGAEKAAVAEVKKEAAAEKKEAAVEKKEGAEEAKEGKEASEFIVFDKAKMGNVKFPHKAHAEMNGGCATCHEGKEPVFKQERSKDPLKMAEMYAGKSCGTCHDGKKLNKDGKPIFATKGGCMKCHKK
ncbi:hypothetical protein EPO15_15155 [bacterium]|nr:MAG: hypothetical protein EPO15_15155 [bacterium]